MIGKHHVWHLTVAEKMQILAKFQRACRVNNPIKIQVLNRIAVWTFKFLFKNEILEQRMKSNFHKRIHSFTLDRNTWAVLTVSRLTITNRIGQAFVITYNYKKIWGNKGEFYFSTSMEKTKPIPVQLSIIRDDAHTARAQIEPADDQWNPSEKFVIVIINWVSGLVHLTS